MAPEFSLCASCDESSLGRLLPARPSTAVDPDVLRLAGPA